MGKTSGRNSDEVLGDQVSNDATLLVGQIPAAWLLHVDERLEQLLGISVRGFTLARTHIWRGRYESMRPAYVYVSLLLCNLTPIRVSSLHFCPFLGLLRWIRSIFRSCPRAHSRANPLNAQDLDKP